MKNITVKHLVIGYGQIGKAIEKVLLNHFNDVQKIDIGETKGRKFDVLHFCFPYSGSFLKEAKEYQEKYLDPYGVTVVHSTVPIGTCEKLKAVSSPVRGKHPDLAESVLIFEKAFGGPGADRVSAMFKMCGVLRVRVDIDSRSVEAFKLFDTLQYGLAVMEMNQIKKFCDKNGLNFETVYTWANQSYNDGYKAMGMPAFKKYVLKPMPGRIGGHCVIANAKILSETFGFEPAERLVNFDKKL